MIRAPEGNTAHLASTLEHAVIIKTLKQPAQRRYRQLYCSLTTVKRCRYEQNGKFEKELKDQLKPLNLNSE